MLLHGISSMGLLNFFRVCLLAWVLYPTIGMATTLFDASRQRQIPIELYYPANANDCLATHPCPVALLSAGYGVAHTEYRFVAEVLNRAGYLVIAIGHELAQDPPLSVQGNLFETRRENWQRGAVTLEFVQQALQTQLPGFDFSRLTLVGHSNGGDISAWLANAHPELVSALITLDHRRVPLPRNKNIRVLSIRASDFPADEGVLLSEPEQARYDGCVLTIAGAKHNELTDQGPDWLKARIKADLLSYLTQHQCKN